jgi:diacylglycerol kinase family enzyme
VVTIRIILHGKAGGDARLGSAVRALREDGRDVVEVRVTWEPGDADGADGFSWEGQFLARAIGNGRPGQRQHAGLPDAPIDDGLLELTILPALDGPARLDAFSRLLRDGAAGIRATLVTTRSSWICVRIGVRSQHKPGRRTYSTEAVSSRMTTTRASGASR